MENGRRSPGAPVSEIAGQRAFDWLASKFPRFDLGTAEPADIPDEASQTVFIEVAWLALALARGERFTDDERLQRCVNHVLRAYRSPGFHRYILSGHPLAFAGHLVLWIAAEHFGGERQVPRAAIQQVIDSGRVTAPPRTPDRLIELRYFLDRAGFRHALPDFSDLFAMSVLSDPPDAEQIAEAGLYEATHVVIYTTDFGRERPVYLGARRRQITEFLEAALRRCVDARHWDLVAELLFSLRCLGGSGSPVPDPAWHALRWAQDPSGAIPEAPAGGRIAARRCRNPDRAAFLALYHRSLVTVLAGLVPGRQHA